MTKLTVMGNRAIVLAHGTNVATFYVRHYTLLLDDHLTVLGYYSRHYLKCALFLTLILYSTHSTFCVQPSLRGSLSTAASA